TACHLHSRLTSRSLRRLSTSLRVKRVNFGFLSNSTKPITTPERCTREFYSSPAKPNCPSKCCFELPRLRLCLSPKGTHERPRAYRNYRHARQVSGRQQ